MDSDEYGSFEAPNEWDETDFHDEDVLDDDSLEESATEACPNCNRQVYEDAEQCPYCHQYLIGQSGKSLSNTSKILVWVLILALLLPAIVIVAEILGG